ncbi:MAG: L-rhamnose isomerase [Kiritimatiellales bacterium]|nr:L-rhamnose isomerase [Kiritimatiellales bacterium]
MEPEAAGSKCLKSAGTGRLSALFVLRVPDPEKQILFIKSMPFCAVWDMLCEKAGVPVGADWFAEMEAYEADVLSKR